MISVWCSVKGSPGVSSWAMLTAAATLAGQQCVVVEADRDGGSMSSRLMTGVSPGLAELMSVASRSESGVVNLSGVSHRVDEDTFLVPSPPYASEVRTLLGRDSGRILSSAAGASDGRWWFFDVGRHALSESMADLSRAADVAVVVTRAQPEYLAVSKPLVEWFGRAAVVVVVGKAMYSQVELMEFFGVPVGQVPEESAVPVSSAVFSQRRARRTRAFRDARGLGELVAQIGEGRVVERDG